MTASNHNVDARVLVPMKLDAFVLNSAVCSGTDTNQAKIAPLTAPNYTYLRLDETLLRPDVLDHVDLHHTAPAQYNSRFTDLGTGATRVNREGVYLHWMLPRPYRAGAMKDQPGQSSDADVSAPSFFDLPTRWLVIRTLDTDTVEPESARESVQAITAWVVESDRQWELDELDVDVDLQVDVSPFITGGEGVDLEEQAEVFIGAKTPLADWTGEETDGAVKRAKLSLLHSSNPLFADYQPHNSNVFSMVDTFSYTSTSTDATGSETTTKEKLTAATASYYVLGWHSTPDKDLFAAANSSRADRLQELNMVLKSSVGADDWNQSKDGTRLLCHGALYDVKWDLDHKPQTVLADKYANVLNSNTGSSVAVGTTSLDALIAYIAAQKASSSDSDSDDVDSSEAKIKELEDIIFAMQTLLHARDDGVDTRLEAADQVNNWNYSRSDGGYIFHPSSSSSTTDANSANTNDGGDANKIDTLNKMQPQLDATRRAERQTRWNLFSLWWKCITDNANDDTKYKEDVKKQSDHLKYLQDLSSSLQSRITTLATDLDVKKTAADCFYEQRDPTLLLAGIPSGWPYDFRDMLEVRLDYQTVHVAEGASLPYSWKHFIADALTAIPSSLRSAAKALMIEFAALGQKDDSDGSGSTTSTSSLSLSTSSTDDDTTEVYPLYHDQGWNPTNDANAPWRDSWGDTQPWLPLFVEWEVEYTHIPFDYWSLGEHSARLSQELLIRGGIRDDIVLYEHSDALAKDRRLLSGRTIILPQPVMALQTLVAQILADTSDSQLAQAGIPRSQVQELQNDLYQLALISAPLAGFHDHLATRTLGNHVKPNNRLSANELETIVQAVRDDAGLTEEVLKAMQTNTNPTPYGFLVDFSSSDASPFKPAVHGQFKFTKINIVDKFGQAIHAIDPTPRPRSQGIPPLYPCISDFYEPQVVINEDDSVQIANTVVEEDQSDLCRYIQVPPHINQAIRFNGALVTLEQSIKDQQKEYYWRPAADGDNPVWGWVVANRADNGLQFFRSDGSFYCEVRLSGPDGGEQPKWLPFAPPTTAADPSIGGAATAEFEEFISKFHSADYLRAFAKTVELALENLPAVPNSYANYLNAAIGKPLALVNMAWSLELAVPEYANQSSLTSSAKPESLHDHSWKVKLGDKQRSFDGLIAYFQASDKQDRDGDGDEDRPSFDFDTFYTYYYPPDDDQSETQDTDGSQSQLCPITSTNYPAFEPFWLDPLSYAQDYDQHYVDRCKKLTAFAALMDPFTSVHAFSSFFPVQKLRLPPWTWQAAMNKMTTFFQMGPLVIPADVPLFQQQYSLQAGHQLAAEVPGSAVQIPALKVADWAWLQPYVAPATGGGGADQSGASTAAAAVADSPAYMPLGLSMLVDGRPRLEVGPYTAVEGYLQLKTPILRPSGGGDSN